MTALRHRPSLLLHTNTFSLVRIGPGGCVAVLVAAIDGDHVQWTNALQHVIVSLVELARSVRPPWAGNPL